MDAIAVEQAVIEDREPRVLGGDPCVAQINPLVFAAYLRRGDIDVCTTVLPP